MFQRKCLFVRNVYKNVYFLEEKSFHPGTDGLLNLSMYSRPIPADHKNKPNESCIQLWFPYAPQNGCVFPARVAFSVEGRIPLQCKWVAENIEKLAIIPVKLSKIGIVANYERLFWGQKYVWLTWEWV